MRTKTKTTAKIDRAVRLMESTALAARELLNDRDHHFIYRRPGEVAKRTRQIVIDFMRAAEVLSVERHGRDVWDRVQAPAMRLHDEEAVEAAGVLGRKVRRTLGRTFLDVNDDERARLGWRKENERRAKDRERRETKAREKREAALAAAGAQGAAQWPHLRPITNAIGGDA